MNIVKTFLLYLPALVVVQLLSCADMSVAFADAANNTNTGSSGTGGQGAMDLGEIRRRRIVEKNGIADSMCLMVSIMRSDLSRGLIGISLFAVGVGAFFGKLSFGWFFSFIIGTVAFFTSTSVLAIIVPFSDINEGCECKTSIPIYRDDTGKIVKQTTMLKKDCKTLDDPNQQVA